MPKKNAKSILRDAALLQGEKVLSVQVKGLPPGLLMNSPQSMMDQDKQGKTRKRGDIPSPKEDAEARAYRMQDGTLYIPSTAIYSTMVNSAGQYKIGKKSATGLIAGTIRIWPLEISLGTKAYQIDQRPVVVQRNRIIRARPWVPKWSADFFVIYDPSFGVKPEDIKKLLVDAGRRVGILDFRPQHRGQFGRFLVTKCVPYAA